ncbi:MAG: hypothetical protein KDF65_06930 [Anaerolineae bacterium]|nr:hypothetical protein [Anaerolineae bacterium]
MDFVELVEIVGDEPVFETGLLLAGPIKSADVQRQLSRWTKAGRLYQLRRGLYALAPPYQKTKPHPFLVANRMVQGAYVSLQSALAFYGLIPEHVPVVTSVTTARPHRWETPLGNFEFRHIKADLFWGYRLVDVGDTQQAFIARPEKAILDLVHLEPNADSSEYLRELRLQNLEKLDLARLQDQAGATGSPKLRRAAATIANLARIEAADYEIL